MWLCWRSAGKHVLHSNGGNVVLFLMCCAGSCVAQVGSLPSFSPPLQVYQKECLREELHEEQWEWEEASGTFDFCLVLLCNHVLLLLLFLWICTFIFLCLRPVYVYSYLPSSNSTVSKGMKDVLVPTPPTRQKYVSHFVFQGQRDAWGDLRLIFFFYPPLHAVRHLSTIFSFPSARHPEGHPTLSLIPVSGFHTIGPKHTTNRRMLSVTWWRLDRHRFILLIRHWVLQSH